MRKVLLAGPRHRIAELNSIAERFKKIPDAETIVVTLHEDMDFSDIRKLIRNAMDSEMVFVVEVGYEYQNVNDKSAPLIALHNPTLNKMLVRRMPSLQDILHSKKKKFNVITVVILSLAEKLHKDVVVLPWRGDAAEEPTYTPPECWLDNIDSDNVYYYE